MFCPFLKNRPTQKSEEAKTHFKGKRFHGAFTGGFTAGYYNTVGSAEGWTPSSFVSTRGGSRGDAATTHQQRIEELMDAEDRADLLGASLVALPEYERLGDGSVGKPGSVASASTKSQRGVSGARRPTTTSIGGASVGAVRLAPPTQPRENLVGRRLLMGMGWRQGDGVGPRARDMDDPDDARTGLPDSGATTDAAKRTVSERDQDDNHVPTAEIEPAPHDSKESGQQRVFGASLPPGLQRKAKVAAVIDNSKPVRYKFRPVDAALRIFVRKDDSYGLGYAPGPDDVGLERMGAAGADRGGDQHGTGLGTNRVRLDSVMASGGGAGGGRNGPNVGVGYGEDDEDVFGYGSSMRNFDTSLDVGGGAASGRRGKGGGKESGRTGRDRWGGGRGTDTSGGRPYVPELVDRNRVTLDDFVPAGDSGIGSVDQRGEYPLPRVPRAFDERKVFAAPLVRTQLDLGREQLTARHRAFLLNTDAESAAREERYRAFLLRKSGVGNATTGSPNAAAPESAEETLEFRTRAMLFKSDKAATSLSSRFAPAGSGKSGAAAGAGGGADDNLPADVKAARAGRFGSETRAVIEWVPDSLLCKRFSVANPYKHRRPSGAADTSSAGEVLDALRRKESEFATAAAEDAATEAAMALAPPRQQLQLVNSGGGGGGGGGVNPASRRGDDNVVPPKPPVDLFKAIFEVGSTFITTRLCATSHVAPTSLPRYSLLLCVAQAGFIRVGDRGKRRRRQRRRRRRRRRWGGHGLPDSGQPRRG